MKIFVTGGCGFIGSNFIIMQVDEYKNSIMNYDKLTYSGNKENLSSLRNNSKYEFIEGDVCDTITLKNSIYDYKPDIIVHFAAESHVDNSIKNPQIFVKTNVLGTMSLLNASFSYFSENKSNLDEFKFLHISTDEVFGSLDYNDAKFTESSHYLPNSPYSASKAGADHLVRSWFKTYEFPSIITNCSNNYGPYQYPEKLIPLIISKIFDKKPLPIYGDGQNIRDWIYVNDHCKALNAIINNGKPGESYCIGGNNEKTNLDLVETLCEIFDSLMPLSPNKSYKELIAFVPDRLGHDFRYAIDSSKIKNQLSWMPDKDFYDGLKETAKWYIDNESWWRKIQNKI